MNNHRGRPAGIPRLQQSDVEAIRGSAVQTLATVGALVKHRPARDALAAAGAIVEGERVRVPERVVTQALAHAPREVIFHDRAGRSLSSADGISYHGPAPSALYMLEHGGGRRTASYRDVADLTLLLDSLPGIDFISPPAIAQDGDPSLSGLRTAEAVFCNTEKFCLAFALDRTEASAWLSMASLAAAGDGVERPTVGFAISPTSPLLIGDETGAILLQAALAGAPIVTVPGGMAGATSPYTIAGTLVVEHAEALLVATIAQLVRPGTPCLLGMATAVIDMASGSVSLGTPERTLILNAAAQLARAWELPGYVPAGLTDSFTLDVQAGAEKMLSLVSNFALGVEFSSGVGRYEGGLSTSLEGVLIDHELLQAARRYLRGFAVDAETLAAATIAEIGPAGEFLDSEHTRRHLRTGEFAVSSVFNRRAVESGGLPAHEAARIQVGRHQARAVSAVPLERQAAYREVIARHMRRG